MTANDLLVGRIPAADHSATIDSLTLLANQAGDFYNRVRESILMPHPRKIPPTFSTASLAELCGIDKHRVTYLSGKGELPVGTSSGNGRAKMFTLEQAMAWIKAESKRPMRPTGARGRVLAVANFKGGVAKTATTVALAQALTLRGRRVLLIDCDPQGSATQLCGYAPDAEIADDMTLLPLIYEKEQSVAYAIRETYWANLDLVPASTSLFDAEFEIPAKVLSDSRHQFWDIVNKGIQPVLNDYDVVIFDTPPALSYLTINALLAADAILMPCPPEGLDFASSTQFWRLFSEIAGAFPGMKEQKRYDFVNVVMTKARSIDTSVTVQGWLHKAYGERVLPFVIPESKIQVDASAALSTIYDLSKADVRSSTYARLREPLDQLADYVDSQFVAAWAKEASK